MKGFWRKRNVLWMVLVLTACFCTACLDETSENVSKGVSEDKSKTIGQLMELTDYTVDGKRCVFQYHETEQEATYEGWRFVYLKDTGSNYVNIKDQKVSDIFVGAFGADYTSKDESSSSRDGFAYSLEQNTVNIYFDYEMDEGHLSIVSYDRKKNDYMAMLDGEKYSLSDEFMDYIKESQLADIANNDIAQFERCLEKNGLTVEELQGLKYDEIVSLYPESEAVTEQEGNETGLKDQEETGTDGNQGISELGTPITGTSTLGVDYSITINQVKEFTGASKGGKKLYVAYSVENIGERSWVSDGITLYGDGKSIITYVEDIDEDMKNWNIKSENGADILRPNGKDDYYVIAEVNPDEFDLLELDLGFDNEQTFIIKNGDQSCIEMLDDTSVKEGKKDQKQDTEQVDASAFYGDWHDTYSQRCGMSIYLVNDLYYDIEINWGSSAWDNTHWVFSGEYDAAKGGIVYTDGCRYEEHYSDGGNKEQNEVYSDGSGLIYLKNGKLYWNDDKENAGKDCVFEKVNATGDGDYILPDSDSVRLTEADIQSLSLREINYAKNEIYARHGRKFLSQELKDYFNSKSWYVGLTDPEDFNDDVLSQVEKENAKMLTDAEFALDPNGYQLDQ